MAGLVPHAPGVRASTHPVEAVALEAYLGARGMVDLGDTRWRASDLAGRVVLLDAWASWCAPCLAELPNLKALSLRYPDDFVVLGLSLDTMPRRDFISWLRRHDVGWPQVFDGRGYGGSHAQRLGLTTLPASWLFAPDGRLAAVNLRGEALDRAVVSLVDAGQ
ncbi:MAG: TlpA disulfide reductase family protein [Ilumatobacteraceae bacterium]